MEGAVGDPGIPDSWEVADLEESMSRLRVSSAAVAASSTSPAAAASSTSPAAAGASAGDVSGQVDEFLREALEKPRERLSTDVWTTAGVNWKWGCYVLRMEQDIEKFLRDPAQQQLELKPLPNSYLRLAAYRIAQHYCLQSMALPDNSSPDGSSSRIVLQKTSESCSPPIRLADIPVNLPQDGSHSIVKVAIKQRPQKHSQTVNSGNTISSKANHSKSVEERKEEYNRARARIFSSNHSSGNQGKSENEAPLLDSFEHSSLVSTQLGDGSVAEGPEINGALVFGYPSGGSSRSRGRAEKELVVNGHKASSRVAIFRDREMDRKDPDYDRNYERYMQRFDPGFGFNGGTYGIQPLYTPAVNYNTEFPQLGASHGPRISVDHQLQIIPQHLHGPWGGASASSATLGYGPSEGLVAPFNANHAFAHSNSSIYMPSSHYIAPPRPGTGLIHPHEHGQHFAQTHQQHPEASFGSARPR